MKFSAGVLYKKGIGVGMRFMNIDFMIFVT
jgi:hypothetical protein